MNDRFKDFFEVTGKALQESFAKLNKVYIAFIVILIRAFYQNYRFTGMFSRSMAGGLLNYFIDAAMLCFVAQALRSIVVYGNSGKKSIGNSLSNFLNPILRTVFYTYLLQMMIGTFQSGFSFSLYMLLLVGFEILFSAMLEEVYINGKAGIDAIKSSAKFVCDNIIPYGLFSLIFIIIEVYFSYNFTFQLAFGLEKAAYILLFAIIQLFFYVVRGHMFKYLNYHPYRQRKFMRS